MKMPFFKKVDLSQLTARTSLKEVLSGNIFTKEFFRKQLPWLLLVVFFVFVYINNGFRAQAQQQRINALQRDIKEARYLMLDLSSEYTTLTRRSAISSQLQRNNSNVRESVHPAIRIR